MKTHRGLKRAENEDSFLIVDENDQCCDIDFLGRLFAVADGMGGHKGGALASSMACEGLRDYYASSRPINNVNSDDFRLQVLKGVFHRVHSKIHEYSLKKKELEGMGTTLSALVLLPDAALIAHIGDSRIYRLRHHGLEKLTRDHTMAQLSVEMGYMDQEVAEDHPLRHALTDALGQGIDEIQITMTPVAEGDTFLLCTDGLHHGVPDGKIQEILEGFALKRGLCDRLVREALNRGGRDNITVIAIRV